LETRLPIAATDPNSTAADTHVDGDPFTEDPRVDNDEHSELPHPPPRQRRTFNWQGMGGNQNHHNQHYVRNDDPFAKVKFSIPPFNGSYDAEAYLDWEMIVEQKFSSHLVPEQHRVRQATSEFKDFALIWWNELATLGIQPHTWDGLKTAMRQRFVPPSYQRDLRKKLQRLSQRDMSIQDYYVELQKGMIRARVHEETEDKICHFYGGLWTEIQDIIDYKEYNTVNHLFQLAMLAEKELQGRQPTRLKSSFTPRHTSMTPSTSRAPGTAHFSTTPSTSRVPSISMAPPPASRASEMTPPAPRAVAKPSSSSSTSTDRTSDIKCHCCHGVGHFQRDCPSKKSYIATDDGGYVSASDVEDDFALQTNNVGDLDDDDAEVFGSEHTEEYSTKTYVVQRVLSA
jgi:hypothetical protein